ncbi:MAG: glycosyltransferase family 4 protein [Anaerolineae bacterium]|nr:glycosyltransferase family 4 protein [Anaerolineae bacterium]
MTTNLLSITTYTGIGGGESLQLNLMRALDRSRFQPYLLTPHDGAFPQAAAALGVSTHTLPYRGTTTLFVPQLWERTPIVGKLRQFLKVQSIHAVLTDYHSLPFIVPAAQALKIPVIWNAMGWWFPIYPWQRHFFEKQISKIIAITAAVKERLLGTPPKLPPNSMEVLIPGVDTDVHQPHFESTAVRDKLGITQDTPLVCMIARFQNVKGHEYFLEMAKHVLAQVPEARFAVAGENVFGVSKDEQYKQDILAMANSDALLRERVTYLGFWQDSREVIAAADVMVCSSWFESLSMVALESMAMARPIVSTRVGGPSETIIDGVTGYLVPPRNSRALAEKVVTLLCDPQLRQRVGTQAREHVVEHFSAARYAAAISEVVQQMLKKRR